MRLLITRPEGDGERSAAALRARGHEVLLAPLLRIEPVEFELGPGPWAAVLISSANALHGLEKSERLRELAALPLFAVGDRTATAARAAGFTRVVSAQGDSRDLAATVLRQKIARTQRLLYLCGADRAGDIAGTLAQAGLRVEAHVAYRAAAVAHVPAEAGAALIGGRIDGVLHYSLRTAEAYVRAAEAENVGKIALAPVHFCLSERIAAPLRAAGAADVRIAERPTEAFLWQLIPPP